MNKFRALAAFFAFAALALAAFSLNYISSAQSVRQQQDEPTGTKDPVVVSDGRICGTDSDPVKIAAMEKDFADRRRS